MPFTHATHAGVPTGTARLSGGRVDPEGAWAYGRLEVFDGIAFSGIIEPSGRFSRSGLGRNAAVVACRSLGFEDGVEITAGSTSALPGPAGDVQTINSISCEGDEAALGECDISTDSGYGIDYGAVDGSTSVAVLCSTPSGTHAMPSCLMVSSECMGLCKTGRCVSCGVSTACACTSEACALDLLELLDMLL